MTDNTLYKCQCVLTLEDQRMRTLGFLLLSLIGGRVLYTAYVQPIPMVPCMVAS